MAASRHRSLASIGIWWQQRSWKHQPVFDKMGATIQNYASALASAIADFAEHFYGYSSSSKWNQDE